MPTKEPYPSDLTDAEWKLLEPLLPGPKKLGRPARYSRRLVLNAIFYRRAQWLRVAAFAPRSALVAVELLLLYEVAAGRALGAAQ
jgi:transposase